MAAEKFTLRIRLVGIFGFGKISGYFGKYMDPSLGRLTFYATRTDRSILLETQKEKIIISPDQPDQFIKEIVKFKSLVCAM